MKVINIHRRAIAQPKAAIAKLFDTLASERDQLLATDKWPAMFLDEGLKVGSKGGHGIIRYTVVQYTPGDFISFRFTRPQGFHGVHEFRISALASHQTELRHEIHMNIHGWALLTWPFAIRWLHDAFIEDAFDKVENHYTTTKKATNWTLWVRFLRGIFKLLHKKNTLLKGAF